MRNYLTLILLCCAFICKAQINSQSSANSNRPTFDEWMKQNNWNRLEEDYYNIVMSLHYCYMQIGDITSTQKLLSSAMAVYNQRSSNPNSEYTRALWLCMGHLEFTL